MMYAYLVDDSLMRCVHRFLCFLLGYHAGVCRSEIGKINKLYCCIIYAHGVIGSQLILLLEGVIASFLFVLDVRGFNL
jgi:hypothetical protein